MGEEVEIGGEQMNGKITFISMAKEALEKGHISLAHLLLEQEKGKAWYRPKKEELNCMLDVMKATGEVAPDAPFADGEYALCRVCEGYHDHRNHEVEKA